MSHGADLQAVIELASGEEDGALCSDAVRSALLAVVDARRGPDAPASPSIGLLAIRRSGLPDWWGPDNLLLAAPGVEVKLEAGFMFGPRVGNVGVVGEESIVGGLAFAGAGGLIVVGDRVKMLLGQLASTDAGTVLIGEDIVAMSWARVDARNGGAVLVGADSLWENDINLLTDDMHAIREVASGRRTNGFGGRVVIERHVLLCDQVRLTAGAHVGVDSVVGMRAWVRGEIPPGSVCVGSPARPIRRGVTWTREDLP